MKHAFCIIAHADPVGLNALVSLLDHVGNDIILLVDSKASPGLESGLKVKNAVLNIIPVEKRIDIRWGGLSQVKAELILFREALKAGNHDYIHLISGADLPLKSMEEIRDFFSSMPPDSNFVAFSEGEDIRRNVEFKTRYYHPFVEFQRFRNDGNLLHFFQDLSAKLIRKISVSSQKIIRFKRNWKGLAIKKGSQWVSISSPFAKYLVDNEIFILKRFKGVICPDEIFIQTMLFNSPFAGTVVNDNLRKIDWKMGTPYIWHTGDFEELKNSGALFARKFSSDADREIIDKINHYLRSVSVT